MDTLLPEGWKRPGGYSVGVSAKGRAVYVAGQIGWDPERREFESDDFVDQVGQALRNILAVLVEGGARPEHIVRMTWYVTDMETYKHSLKALGAVYRETIGAHYPPMTCVQVVSLVEPRAKVEIEVTAVVE